MQVKITENAKTDIREIKSFIAKDNKSAAVELVRQLKNIFVNLAIYPKIGRYRYEFQESGIRSFVFKKYIIVYRINNSEIEILRVLSGYQNYLDKFLPVNVFDFV